MGHLIVLIVAGNWKNNPKKLYRVPQGVGEPERKKKREGEPMVMVAQSMCLSVPILFSNWTPAGPDIGWVALNTAISSPGEGRKLS